MKNDWDPRRLDIRAFARAQARLQGTLALRELPRLAVDSAGGPASAEDLVRWTLAGQLRAVAGGQEQVWLRVTAEVTLTLVCQRCLGPVASPVTVARDFRFVADEATAALEDEDADEDVLVWSRAFDALALIEDELLMALPLVPMHEACPGERVLTSKAGEAPPQERAHPFAALAALRKNQG